MKKNEMTKKLMEEFNEDFIDVGGVLDTTLPDPTMVEYYRRLKKREILWNDDISDATTDTALCDLLEGLADKVRDIDTESLMQYAGILSEGTKGLGEGGILQGLLNSRKA